MNKINLEFYNPTKTYLYPNMEVATPERIQAEYSAVNVAKCIITTDSTGTMFYSVELAFAMAQRLGVEVLKYTTDEELLLVLEDIVNAQPVIQEAEPTAEERIAAALEYQNLMSM